MVGVLHLCSNAEGYSAVLVDWVNASWMIIAKQQSASQKTEQGKFNKELTTICLDCVKLISGETHKTIKETKKKSWRNYVSKRNSSAKKNAIWEMIFKKI